MGADPTTPEETDLQSAAVADLLLSHKKAKVYKIDSAYLTSGRFAITSINISAIFSRVAKNFSSIIISPHLVSKLRF